MDNSRVRIYIDFSNLVTSNRSYSTRHIDLIKLVKYLAKGRLIETTICFASEQLQISRPAYVDYLTRNGFEFVFKRVKRTHLGDRADLDVNISVAIAEQLLNRNRATIILVSGDGDFVPVLKLVRQQNCRIEIAGYQIAVSRDLEAQADNCTFLDDINEILMPPLEPEQSL